MTTIDDGRNGLQECGICGAGAGQPCDYNGTHVGRRWEIYITHPGYQGFGSILDTSILVADNGPCRPTVEAIHELRGDDERGDRCGPMIFRGACLGCGWFSAEAFDDENPAVADAHDHAMPGWRNLPVVGRVPHEAGTGAAGQRLYEKWFLAVGTTYRYYDVGTEWLPGNGAPIRTQRTPRGARSHWNPTTRGYDIAAEGDTDPRGQLTLFNP